MHNSTVLLHRQIQGAEALKQLPKDSPQYKVWSKRTATILRDNFDRVYVEMFYKTEPVPIPLMDEEDERRAFLHALDEKVNLLKAIIEEYDRLEDEPVVALSRSVSLQAYDFHQEIKVVALRLYEDKHYAQAVEEAFKRVIKQVKRIVQDKTGQEYMRADDLMNKAFSPQNPVIKFNQLQTSEDKDEQQGMMFLFKGIVGIRNKKAHDNVILNDSMRAIEYLSLASLLMRLLDQFAA